MSSDLIENTEYARKTNANCPWVQNMDFVNAAFGYQKEALELRNKISHSKTRKVKQPIRNHIKLLLEKHEKMKREDIEDMKLIEELKLQLESTSAELEEMDVNLKKLSELNMALAQCWICGRKFPDDIVSQCKHEIDTFDNI